MAKPIFFLLLAALFTISAVAQEPVSDGGLAKCLTDNSVPNNIIFAQSNPSFQVTLQNYIRNARGNTSETRKPLLIVTPLEAAHVQAAVTCSKTTGLQLKTRSGGHDYECVSYTNGDVDFFVLDMFNMRSVTVDVPNEVATVQCGAILGEVYFNIWNSSKTHAFPAGACPTVGVGGHLSGGGYGNLMRKYGLSVDNVIDAEIVDANAKVLDRKAMGEDLFWAIRGGGGGSFGVILSYTIKLVRVPEKVTVFRIQKTLEEQATALVSKFQEVAPTIDPDLFMRMLIQPISSKTQDGQTLKTVRVSVLGLFLGDTTKLVGITGKDFPGLGLKPEDCKEMSWIQTVLWWANLDVNTTQPAALLERHENHAGFLKRKSDYIVTPIPADGLESLWKKLIELEKVGMVLNSCGGKMDEIPATETPFPRRAGTLFKIQYSVSWKEAKDTEMYLKQAKDVHEFMTPFVSENPRGAYLNYRDLDVGVNSQGPNSYEEGKVYGPMFFGLNYDRLVKVKTAVDPDNLFRNQQSIPVDPSGGGSPTASPPGPVPARSLIRKIGPSK